MSRYPRAVIGLAVLVAALLASVVRASAATPSATPDVPPPESCAASAPSFERLNALLASPVALGTPTAAPTPGVLPEGFPASAEELAGITATTRELVACYNAGELLRSYGLYTEAYLGRLFARQGAFTRAAYDGLATPGPAGPETWTAIIEIRDVRVLEDGTVGAIVTLRYARIPMPKTFFFTFARAGDRWLIDGILGEISFSVP